MRWSWLALALASCGEKKSERPNILIFTMDTTRWDALSAYGNRFNTTPAIDQWAAKGTRFDRAYTVTPLTIPAHSSLFTGHLPPRHGVRDNGDYFLGEGALTLAEQLQQAGYATMASVGAEVTSHHWGFAQGFDSFYDNMGTAVDQEQNRWRVERPGTEVIADAQRWFGEHASDPKPWFAWIHLFDAHHPYTPLPDALARVPESPYLAEVSHVDQLIGTVLSDLEAKGELDNTWIVFLADHGEGMGTHGEMLHGVLLYDATTRIPMIIIPPTRNGAVVEAPVSIVDITPTLLAVAGIAIPEGLDGKDLSQVVTGQSPPTTERDVYVESLYAYHHYGWAPQRKLVDANYKLMDSTTPELYGAADVHDQKNLATTDEQQLKTMRERLQTWGKTLEHDVGMSSKATLSDDRLAQLAALGYVTLDAPDLPTEGLPDPVSHLPVLGDVEVARQALQAGDLETAQKRLESVIAAEPGLVEPVLLLTTIKLRTGELQEAETLMTALDARAPGSNTKAMLGQILVAKGEYEAAEEMFRQSLEKDPFLASTWMSYVGLLISTSNVEEAAVALTDARKRCPDSAGLLAFEGMVRIAQGDDAGGKASLESALARDASLPLAHQTLALIYRRQGDMNRAETLLLDEVRLFPPALAARRGLVEIYAEQRQYDEQLMQLQVIAAQETPNALTLHSTAQVLFNLRRYEESYKLVEECKALDASYAPCVMLEANVLKKLGRGEEATEAYHRALKLAGEPLPEQMDGKK